MHRYILYALVLTMTSAVPCLASSVSVQTSGLGEKDDSAIIQTTMNICAEKGGGTVSLPVGKYRLDKPITIPSGVILEGDWAGPHHAQLDKGTIILAYAGKGKETDPPLIKLSPSSMIKGMTIYYPEQKLPGVIAYPWTIQGEGMHCSVLDLTLVNPYKAIDFGTYPNELHYIRNVFGCPLRMGVFVDKCTDIGRIENVHFNQHYWVRAVDVEQSYWDPLFAEVYLNCTAFKFGQADWEYVTNTFSIACKIGYHFVKGEGGACNGSFLGIGADFAQSPILIEETKEAGILITNGEFVGGNGVHTETHVEVKPSHTGVVQFNNCSFWGPVQNIARIAGSGTVSMSQCNMVQFTWDTPSGKPAVEINGGSVTLMNCRLFKGWDRITLGPDTQTAVIMGNTAEGTVTIDNQSKGDVQVVGNIF